MYPTYTELKKTLASNEPIHMTVSGHAWGMACNSIHFLDLFAYLTGEPELKLMTSQLDEKLIESKRAGFYEVTGQIEFCAGEHTISIQSGKEATFSFELVVKQGLHKHVVNEVGGKWDHITPDNTVSHPHLPLYQSQLTAPSIDALLESNQCTLTPYKESSVIHTPFIAAMLQHMSGMLKRDLDICPIT
jgi:hypothetical protein